MVAFLFVALTIFQVFHVSILSEDCNEHVCASIVSKCMLTQSCKCDTSNNVTCARECFICLDNFYSECCSCFDMCPSNNSTSSLLSAISHVEELDTASAELFTALTEEKDALERWVAFTIPIQMSLIVPGGSETKQVEPGTKIVMKTDGQDTEEDIQVNCTVAYMTQCMSWNKCKSSCRSMGAVSYRWFHDGCCECVGPNCINYGINESKCLHCPLIITKTEEPPESAPNSVSSK